MTVRSSRCRRSLRVIAATLVFGGVSIVGTATAANATSGCGEYSFGFEGTRLLNDGISDSAGPFAISMPAGTYDITLHSFDDHAAHPGQFEQTQEQWYFTLDSGYTSPVSSDIPDDSNTSADTFTGVVIEDATAITVHHLREGGINSVAPMCVGFTTSTPAPTPGEKEVLPPPTEPVVKAPEVVVPAKQVNDSPEAPVVPVEVKPVVEVQAPPAAAPTPAVAPQLAITGPSAHTSAMVLLGSVLVLAGIGLVAAERRQALVPVRRHID